MNKKILAVICMLLLCVSIAACGAKNDEPQASSEVPAETTAAAEETAAVEETEPETTAAPEFDENTLVFNGEGYPMRENLRTVLLIGTDDTETYSEEAEGERDFRSYHNADFLLLMVMDRDANAVNIIQLNRDTMTDVPWLDIFGEFGGTEYKQLCRAFNYGDGGISSCRNTMHAVSLLLNNVPIDGYIQLPMSEIGTVNDAVGGVTVHVTEDMTVIDPSFVEDATVTLRGKQAEMFLRARKALEDDTNTSRMRRHREYMENFQIAAKSALENNPDFLKKLLKVLDKVVQTNLGADDLLDMAMFLDECEINPVLFADGELTVGEEYYEFYVDENSLWECVRTAFCE